MVRVRRPAPSQILGKIESFEATKNSIYRHLCTKFVLDLRLQAMKTICGLIYTPKFR